MLASSGSFAATRSGFRARTCWHITRPTLASCGLPQGPRPRSDCRRAMFRDLTLYVIRHGECEHNVEGRAASWDDSPLTVNGRAQARANGALLKQLAGDLSHFDFFASPIHRT